MTVEDLGAAISCYFSALSVAPLCPEREATAAAPAPTAATRTTAMVSVSSLSMNEGGREPGRSQTDDERTDPAAEYEEVHRPSGRRLRVGHFDRERRLSPDDGIHARHEVVSPAFSLAAALAAATRCRGRPVAVNHAGRIALRGQGRIDPVDLGHELVADPAGFKVAPVPTMSSVFGGGAGWSSAGGAVATFPSRPRCGSHHLLALRAADAPAAKDLSCASRARARSVWTSSTTG